MENIHILAEYEEIFGEKQPELSEVLGDEVYPNMMATLSMLSWKNHQSKINVWVENNIPLTEKGRNAAKNSIFTNNSSSICLWLYLINRLCENKFDIEEKKDQHYEKIIRCITILNSKEHEKENNNGYLINNGYNFYRDNYYWQINRAVRSLVNEKRMKVYIKEFEKHYNVSLIDYLGLHFYLARFYTDRASNLLSVRPSTWIIDLDILAKETRLNSDMLERIMMTSSFSVNDFNAQYINFNKKNIWFNYLRQFPYFRLSEKKYIPINGKLAENLLYNELFHKIKITTQKPMQFMTDYGHCFESYVTDLIKLASKKSKHFNYKFMGEFNYDSNSKKSSDAYIYFRDEKNSVDVVIVIEIKAKRIREQAKGENPTTKEIQISIDNTIRNPLSQAISVTCDIIKKGINKVLTKDKIYYFMSVSMDGYTGIFGNFDSSINPKYREEIKVGGVYPVTIEGFECFIRVLMSNIHYPANILLSKFKKCHSEISFKTYMARLSNDKDCQSEDFDTYITKSINVITNNFVKQKNSQS